MSMLSAQCDELRAMAQSVGLAMPQVATLMMGAADTILEMRDDLQRANDAVRDAEHDESCAWDRVRKAEAEADRLRELVRYMWFADYAGHFSTLPEHQEQQATVWQRMRELGIEVDE